MMIHEILQVDESLWIEGSWGGSKSTDESRQTGGFTTRHMEKQNYVGQRFLQDQYPYLRAGF